MLSRDLPGGLVSVSAVMTLLAIVVAPVGLTVGILSLLRRVSRQHAFGGRRGRLEVLVEDLSRFGAEPADLVQRARCTDGGRLRTVAARYDETLLACCAELGVPAPGGLPLSGLARLEAEAALAQQGLRW